MIIIIETYPFAVHFPLDNIDLLRLFTQPTRDQHVFVGRTQVLRSLLLGIHRTSSEARTDGPGAVVGGHRGGHAL